MAFNLHAPMIVAMNIRPDRIKKRRADLRYTQVQLAKQIGVSQKAIAKWESGRTKTRPAKLKELAEALECTEDWLLGGDDKPSTPDGVGLISWVQAGTLAEVYDAYQPGDAEMWVDYPARHTKMIALRVKGTSMNRVSPEESIIIVDLLDRELSSNRLYVVKIGDEATYKRYRNNPPRLEPDSTDSYDTIFLNDENVQPVGRVVRTMMDFE